MIDICTFAAGLSRQLAGLTLASERANHRMMETWHPLGVVGIISAFNFPVAVWSWNAALALVCGNSVVWKPSEKTPLTALATQAIFERAPRQRCIGSAPLRRTSPRCSSATRSSANSSSTRPSSRSSPPPARPRWAAPSVRASPSASAASILELGGNNAAIVCPSADLDLTLRGIAFSAMGTAGQRCTTLRRLIVHESVYDQLIPRLKQVYASVAVGDPREPDTLVGPLIDARAFEAHAERALDSARSGGATITGGERIDINGSHESFYVRPALVEIAQPIRRRPPRNLRAHPLRPQVPRPRRSHRAPQRRSAGPLILHLHAQHARSRALPRRAPTAALPT